MDNRRFESLVASFQDIRVLVLGDFFLDLYISLERSLSELSLETNLEAFQAVNVKGIPGAAGVVTNNLVALGARPSAVAYTGDDGNGYTLRSELAKRGVEVESLLISTERFTPTYIKPMMTEVTGQTIELNRIDVKNRTWNSVELEGALIQQIEAGMQGHAGVLVLEQVKDDGCGVLSPAVRSALSRLAKRYPEKTFCVDSRHFSSIYEDVSLKVNLSEAVKAARELDPGFDAQPITDSDTLEVAKYCQRRIWEKNGKPVFVTLGPLGISGIDEGIDFYHPGFITEGPIDIVGAGDSVLAGCGLALCAGASAQEAAYIGNLVGSITVQQIGTTGTATTGQLITRHWEYQQQIRLRNVEG